MIIKGIDIEKEMMACYENYNCGNKSGNISIPSLSEAIRKGLWDKPKKGLLNIKKETENARMALNNKDKDGYNKIKSSLPVVTPNAYYTDTRNKESIHSLTGIMMLDFDHLNNTESVLEESKKLPCVLLACKSLSGEGCHLLIRYTPISEEDFNSRYLIVMKYIETRLGVMADPACKNVNRVMLINYDPDVYYNPDAIPLDITGALWLEKNSFYNLNIDPEMNEQQQFSKYCDAVEPYTDWREGHRHSSLVSLAAKANNNGFDKNIVIDECIKRYAASDFCEEEIIKVIDFIYTKYAKDFGRDAKTFSKQEIKGSKDQKFISSNDNSIEEEDDDDLELDYLPIKEYYNYLPLILQDCIDLDLPVHEQSIQYISATTAFGAITNNTFFYNPTSEKRVDTNLCSLVMGPSGSGKGKTRIGKDIFFSHENYIYLKEEPFIKESEEKHNQWKKMHKETRKRRR